MNVVKRSEIDISEKKPASEVVLRLRGITKVFGSLVANNDISLELKSGEVLALLGENGAGKTTLMNILFGHYIADSGSIEVFGRPIQQGSPHAAIELGIGMVHQHFTLAGNLKDMLLNIVALADDIDMRGSIRAPSMLLDTMTVAGQ